MTKYRLIALGVVIALGAATVSCAAQPDSASPSADASASCGTVSFAGLDDDTHRAQMWGIESGAVTSDIIDESTIDYLSIPAAIQATGSGQFDVQGSSLPGVVLAREASGMDLKVVSFGVAQLGEGVSLWTRKGSGITSPEDLAGRTLGTFGFGSTSTMIAQIVFADKYGLSYDLEGGDINWVELDPPTLLNALENGDVDAALLFFRTSWLADKNPDLVKVAQLDEDYHEISDGAWPIGSVFIADGPWAEENPQCLAEMQRMIDDSIDYARTNIADFSEEIATVARSDAEFIEWWWGTDKLKFLGSPDSESIAWSQTFYDLAAKHGSLPQVNANDFIVAPSQ